MKNGFKALVLTATVFALASAGANAQNTSTTIALTAQVGSFDNITCTQATLDLNGGTPITTGGMTPGQAVNCFVTSNDAAAINVAAYLPASNPLTGTNPANNIPTTDIEWSPDNAADFVPFAPLTGALAADIGAQVATAVAQGTNTPVNFWLSLNVPATQAADTYSAVMTVAITPAT
jgi:hypothetical protein